MLATDSGHCNTCGETAPKRASLVERGDGCFASVRHLKKGLSASGSLYLSHSETVLDVWTSQMLCGQDPKQAMCCFNDLFLVVWVLQVALSLFLFLLWLASI